MENKLTFIDWFAGIGGFRRGMELAGHKCVGFCERDKHAINSYRAMHDTEGEWFTNDIRTVDARSIPRADVWCGGFPCQDISVANSNGKGLDGDRSGLFYSITNLIRNTKKEDRPSILFFENVKNLLSVNRGFDLLKIFIELDEIGYDVEWQVINSKNYVPQNRERIYIIGHFRGRSGRQVFPISDNGGSPEIEVIGTTKSETSIGRCYKSQVYDPDGLIVSLMASDYKQPKQIVVKQIGNIVDTGNYNNPYRGRIYDPDGFCPTLSCCTGGGQEPKIAIPVLTPDRLEKRQNGRRFKTDGEDMFTLTAQDRHGVMVNGYRIRKITPRESFRLQGWSDDYFNRAASVNSDTQLYKQAGNCVTVNVIYDIAKRF